MKIIKNQKKSWCVKCGRTIDSKFKVADNGDTYHLNCYRIWVVISLKNMRIRQIKLKRFLKLIEKHHKELILESLEKNK